MPTFNDNVINVVNIDETKSAVDGNTGTIYTVPVGRRAIVFIRFLSVDDTGANSTELIFAGILVTAAPSGAVQTWNPLTGAGVGGSTVSDTAAFGLRLSAGQTIDWNLNSSGNDVILEATVLEFAA